MQGTRRAWPRFPVLFEDDHVLAINKPAGVAVHGSSGRVLQGHRTAARAPSAKFLELVHRLDKGNFGHLADRPRSEAR